MTRGVFGRRQFLQLRHEKTATDHHVACVGRPRRRPLEAVEKAIQHDLRRVFQVRLRHGLMKRHQVVETQHLHIEVISLVGEADHGAVVLGAIDVAKRRGRRHQDLRRDAAPLSQVAVDRHRAGQLLHHHPWSIGLGRDLVGFGGRKPSPRAAAASRVKGKRDFL